MLTSACIASMVFTSVTVGTRSSGMYYGGDPPAWTNDPQLSKSALFDARPAQLQGDPSLTLLPATAAAGLPCCSSAARPAAWKCLMRLRMTSCRCADAPATQAAGSQASPGSHAAPRAAVKRAHPLSQLGGYQMPSMGAIGGAKQLSGPNSKPASDSVHTRPPRQEQPHASKKQKVSEEEAAAIAKREAARARVERRTMQAFGLA